MRSRSVPREKQSLRPIWDAERRELRVGYTVVKVFRQPAANQELILAAFEEEGWPEHIYDPLPPEEGQDSKQRLHDTIKFLNKGHATAIIRFHGDGTGTGVLWELLDEAASPLEGSPELP